MRSALPDSAGRESSSLATIPAKRQPYDAKDACLQPSYGPEPAVAPALPMSSATMPPSITRPHPRTSSSACLKKAAIKYFAEGDDAVVLIDEDLVTAGAGRTVLGAPTTRIAEDMGRRLVGNIAMLGFLTGATSVVGRAAMEEAIRTTVPPKTIDLNLRAFGAGFDYGQRAIS